MVTNYHRRGAYVCVYAESLSRVQFCVTPWTIAHQAPLTMELSRPEYWRGLPFPSPGIFLTQGLNPRLLHLLHWQVGVYQLYHLGRPN